MNTDVIKEMNKYFAAGATLDIEVFDEIYHSSFENIRVDKKGNIVTITKEQFMDTFRKLKSKNQSLSAGMPDDIQYLGTNEYGPYCSFLIKRMKEGSPVLYNFVWQNIENKWFIIREFTVENDISKLVEMMHNSKTQS